MRCRNPFSRSLCALLLIAGAWLGHVAPAQAAQRELLTEFGAPGQLVLDQLAGLRLGNQSGAEGLLGFRYSRRSIDHATLEQWALTLAPSFDVFALDQLSIGGVVSFRWGHASYEEESGRSTKLPSTLSFSLLPRLGYAFRLSDRFAIWPRLGAGYVREAEAVLPSQSHVVQGFALHGDVGLIYRANESLFLRFAPSLLWLPAAGQSSGESSIDTSTLDVGATMSFGVQFDGS